LLESLFFVLYSDSEVIFGCSLVEFLELVFVVLEWDNVFVPAWEGARDLKRDQLSQPGHVSDLLLFKLKVPVEAPVVEAVFEGKREAAGGFNEHNIIYRHAK